MKTTVIKREKWVIAAIYFLLFAVAAAIYTIMVLPVSGPRIGNYIDDIIIPLGIFAAFTVVQAIIFRRAGSFAERQYTVMLGLVIVKALIVFGAEFILDFLNINFTREENIARSVLMISFMVLIFAAAAAEIIALNRMMHAGAAKSGD